MRPLSTFFIGFSFIALGCSSASRQAATVPATKPAVAKVPVSMTMKQRSNEVIPGSDGIRLTVDDVTRGQVIVSVAGKDGSTLLSRMSMQPGVAATLKIGSESYTLTLQELNNSLVGEDFATFVIAGAGQALSEKEKIEKLIAHIGGLQGAKFIRNGKEHSAQEAADHLRTKWQAAGDRIKTAREFIDHLATKSSVSDETYMIKLADGTSKPAGTYLNERLAEWER
jgi:hypothetical protein